MLESLLLWWHRAKTRAKMDRVFSRGEDPYGYGRLPYERARLQAMEEALGGRRYDRVLEVGCAEGAFTERLALAGSVTALDISPVALERARQRLAAHPWVEFVEADLREWSPPPMRPNALPDGAQDGGAPAPPVGMNYDLIVLGDILYYLDKALVRRQFEKTFERMSAWLAPGGRLILAHGFAGPEERRHRQGFRERFEGLGLRLVSEKVVGDLGPVRCLLSVLESRV